MSHQPLILSGQRRSHRNRRARPRVIAFEAILAPAGAIGEGAAHPFSASLYEDEERRTWNPALLSLCLHLGGTGILLYIGAVTRVIPEEMIPLTLIREGPTQVEAQPKKVARLDGLPVPARELPPGDVPRRPVTLRPVKSVGSESITFEKLPTLPSPTKVDRTSLDVERVEFVEDFGPVRAKSNGFGDDWGSSGSGVVGPIQEDRPVGGGDGPRELTFSPIEMTEGRSPTAIKSKVGEFTEGIVASGEIGSFRPGVPALPVAIDLGDEFLHGGRGSGAASRSSDPAISTDCFRRAEVSSYLEKVRDRTMERWVLPKGIAADEHVTLSFRLDAAGSATNVSFVAASDNALGASAVDALMDAAPFTVMDEAVRCLAEHPIRGTFTNPIAIE